MENSPPGWKVSFGTLSTIQKVNQFFVDNIRDIPYYNTIAKESESQHYNIPNLIDLIKLDTRNLIISWEGDKINGICFNRYDDYTIWLSWIITGNRRTGIGKVLLEKLCETATKRGAHKIWCDSRSNNVESLSFLQKNGFSVICEIEQHWYRQNFKLLEKKLY